MPTHSNGSLTSNRSTNGYEKLRKTAQQQAEAKKLTDCTGKAVNDYQQYLESNWVNELRKEFDVKVNAAVFETIKKQLQQ